MNVFRFTKAACREIYLPIIINVTNTPCPACLGELIYMWGSGYENPADMQFCCINCAAKFGLSEFKEMELLIHAC
jgi:hypothetical protein